MTLKALSHDVRSILCASTQINNYKTAIAELVYNSLDAGSTSIAIRVDIQENRLQVIDNGCGILKNDFKALGKRYMTSKVTDIETLKSIPKFYGFRGEFLANLIEISHCVNIVSRHKDGEETWAQTFYENKKRQLVKMTTRPSKGTTVDVKGFLYNLNIQKRAIDPLNELQNIKAFLEQLSIVQNNISLSLRDDSKNEIIFKINKKRNIYQTLSSLFDINQTDIQELQIEKNQYKVTAYIGKTDKVFGRHWIYLNGTFLQNLSKLHKITNEWLKKYLHLTDTKKSKYGNNYEEEHLFKSNIPIYFIFVRCPYNDYDLSSTLRESVVEFKNWEHIKTILEKLIKFYVGDINLKEIKKNEEKNLMHHTNNKQNHDTKYQINKIVNKILGSNSKKIRVSQLQNGIKGKLIKRKKRTKNNKVNQSISKLDNISQQYNGVNAVNIVQESNAYNKDDKNLVTEKDSISKNKHKTTRPTDKSLQVNLGQNKIKRNDFIMKNNIARSKITQRKQKPTKKNKLMSVKKLVPTKTDTKCNKIARKLINKNQQIEVFQNIENTSTIPQESKIMAQKGEMFLKNMKKDITNRQKGVNYAFRNNKHHSYFKRDEDPLSKINKHIIDNYAEHKIKTNTFKTTYDLVQTILESQQVPDRTKYNQGNKNTSEDSIRVDPIINYEHILLNQFSQCYNSYREKQKSICYKIPYRLEPSKLTYESTYSLNIETQCTVRDIHDYDNTFIDLNSRSVRCEDIFKKDSKGHLTQNNPSIYLSNIQTISTLTYQSHNYNTNYLNMYDENTQSYIITNKNKNCFTNKAKYMRFITNQSKDNFIPSNNKYLLKTCVKNKYNGSPARQTPFYSKQVKDKSYTIEFTTNDEMNCSFQHEQVPKRDNSDFPRSNIKNNKHSIRNSYSLSYEPEPTMDFGNTYTIRNSSRSFVQLCNSEHCSNKDSSNNTVAMDIENVENKDNQKNCKTALIYKPECIDNQANIDEEIEPMNFCETVFCENESIEKEFAFSFNMNSKSNDSLYNNLDNNISSNKIIVKDPIQNTRAQNINENISHHFNSILNTNHLNDMNEISHQVHLPNVTDVVEITDTQRQKSQIFEEYNIDCNKDEVHAPFGINVNNFNFKDRLRFLPKGMSQIFDKSGSKAICNYNLDKDYYDDVIYNDFANDIQMQTEIYEPGIQKVEDLATKDIQKFKIKVHKDNTSLFFDEKSLKEALILNQVDRKFIAAIMKGRSRGLETALDYLILFDQHAVHERIRLENNLADYFYEGRWKNVPLDNITIKMSTDEILYLHNYKDKFNQLGLQWSVLDKDKVSISSIPEAILGKNPREVDKIIKAVKSLIIEEINVIKLQKGCIALYPKSIMDLVSSEACRYAIKFGDKLSKSDCVDLLHDLSNCKTPFQCAHGRPVMAVLVNIKSPNPDYNVTIESLKLFKLNGKMAYCKTNKPNYKVTDLNYQVI